MSCWNDAQGLLAGKRFFAHFVPAHVELTLVLCDPLFRRVMGCASRARSVVSHPRLIRSDSVQHLNTGDGVVGHILIKEIIRLLVWRFDWFNILKQGRCPLAGVASDESIEILEAQTCRPQIKWAGLAALPVGDVVIFAIPSGVIAILSQHFSKCAVSLRHKCVVAGESRSEFHDDAGGVGVAVPS